MSSQWSLTPLSKCLAKVIDYRGRTPKKLGREWASTGYRALSANNVKFSGLDKLESINYADEDLYREWMKEEVHRGDLLLTSEAPSGQVMLWDSDEKIVLSQRLFALRTNSTIDGTFLKYYLQSPSGQKEIFRNNSGSTVAGISAKTFGNILIRHPEKNVQQKIGQLLYSIDKKIDCNNRINAELEAMAKALYDYWFVQFDFPDANGKPYKSSGGKMVYNATLKREIPEGWSTDALGNLTSLIRRGISPSYVDLGGTSVLNQKCIREQKILFSEARRHAALIEAGDDRLLRHLDVLINSTGVGTLGRVAFVKRLNEKHTTVDSHVTIVRANAKRTHPDYLAWTMLRFQPIIEAAANGSTGQVELNKAFLEELNIVIPDGSLQTRFSSFVSPLIKIMAAKEKEMEQLAQLRDWLLPLLMNGQVTVA